MLDIKWHLLSLHSRAGAILVTHYMAVFPLTIDLGELDKNGRAEVSFLVTIREVIF